MLYLKDTFNYIFRNFFKLVLFTIIPSVVLAVAGNTSGAFAFFFNFEENALELGNIYKHFSLIAASDFWLGLLGVVLSCFFLSILFSVIERHMKVGRLSFSRLWARLNETLLSVFPYYLVLVAGCELFAFLISVFITVFYAALGSVAIIPSILLVLGTYFVLFIILAQFVLYIPSQIMVGYPFVDSCINSTKMILGKSVAVALDLYVLCIPTILTAGAISVFLPEAVLLKTIFDVLVCNVGLMVLCVYPMVAYFKISGETRRDLEREDKKKNYIT